ncbi:MAG TPA: ZIP family metal transporter [Clostridia bacterium]|jgi:ZIP family zinc transporter|nr:ZIP family metal transporter [Clostridia bacterium]HHY06096.1 ZIP family metal transporter [Clostridia bacterium]
MTQIIMGQSIIAGLATVLGASIILLAGHPGEKTLALWLGFAGGVMSAVVIFDLLPSALVYSNFLVTVLGFICGLFFMFLLELTISFFPSLKNTKKTGQKERFLKMGYLIAIGIALHDLPEGIAIAVGYAAKENLGLIIALAIGLHNIPEGMATAAPLTMGGVSKTKIIFICFLISLFTPLGALLGILLVSITSHFISLLLALAGGAMVFIVKNELLPEAYRHQPRFAQLGFILGLILILTLSWLHH